MSSAVSALLQPAMGATGFNQVALGRDRAATDDWRL